MTGLVERVRAALAEITPTDQDGWDMLALLGESADRIEQLESAIADLGKQASRCFNTDGECMSCFAPAHAGWFGGNGRHEPGCIVAAAINIAKEGA